MNRSMGATARTGAIVSLVLVGILFSLPVWAGDQRVNMVDLLDAYLRLDQGAETAEISLTQPQLRTYVTPFDVRQPQAVQSPLVLKSEVRNACGVAVKGNVRYKVGNEIVPGSHGASNAAVFNLWSLLATTQAPYETHCLDILAMAGVSNECVSAPCRVEIKGVDPARMDADRDAMPDNPFLIPDGAVWLAAYDATRTVCVVNLDADADSVTVCPDVNVEVTVPSLKKLETELDMQGFAAVAVVKVAPELSTLLDAVTGYEDAAEWAEVADMCAPPGGLAARGRFVSVSLLLSKDAGATYVELDALPDALSGMIEIAGLETDPAKTIQAWSYPVQFVRASNDYRLTNVGSSEEYHLHPWTENGQAFFADGILTIPFQTMSVFAPFASAVSIYSVEPAAGAVGAPTDVTIFGDFANLVTAPLVYFGEDAATAVSVPEYDPATETYKITATVPPAPTPQNVPVRIEDADDPTDGVSKGGAFMHGFELASTVIPAGAGRVDASPMSVEGVYTDGAIVLLAAEASDGFIFDYWDVDGARHNEPSLKVEMTQHRQVQAVFVAAVTLTVMTGPGGAGTVTVTPQRTAWPAGSVVFLSARSADGFSFEHWTGDVADPSSADTSIVLDDSKIVTANFAGATVKAADDAGWTVLAGLGVALIGLFAGGEKDSGGGPCFIATAAYGTSMSGDVETLRVFRDNCLLDSKLGSAFVDTYYRISPPIAEAVAKSPLLAGIIRVLLMPVVAVAKGILLAPWVTMALFLLGVAVMKKIFVTARQRHTPLGPPACGGKA